LWLARVPGELTDDLTIRSDDGRRLWPDRAISRSDLTHYRINIDHTLALFSIDYHRHVATVDSQSLNLISASSKLTIGNRLQLFDNISRKPICGIRNNSQNVRNR
jgi:hypothetical protein